jgi:poly(3-hydroxybutyrate) depolymerase
MGSDAGSGSPTGHAGTGSPSGGAGTNGAAGTGQASGGAGDSGSAGTTGAAGTGSNVAGTTGAAGTGSDAAGTTGTAGTGSSAAGTTGAAGTMAAAGTTGAAGTGAAGRNYPMGNSAGCGKQAADPTNAWATHNVSVTVAAAYQPMYNNRKYYLRLPTGYDPAKNYPLIIWGQGCGLTQAETTPVTNADDVNYIHVLMQQLTSCFDTGPADSPDIPYFDVVLKDVQDNYCTDKARVFIGGFSSGSWMTHMIGCKRANMLRGLGSASGGINVAYHMCTGPVAGILIGDTSDTTNPIIATDAATGTPKGSAAARDRLLMENGCSMTDTKPWDPAFPACVAYQGCNPLYPVVWCQTSGMGHSNGGMYSSKGFWKFWSSLMP